MLKKTPVLDKGYVALFSTSMSREQFLSVKSEYQIDDMRAAELLMVHVEVKCPLFVQLFLTEELKAMTKKAKPEAFIPSVVDVAAKDLETSEMIADDIERTTQALLVNPKSYQMDGCDIFISQVTSPLSIYNTLMLSGTLSQWISIIKKRGLPAPIEQYRKAIGNILVCEYEFIREHTGDKETQKRNRSKKRTIRKD